MEQPELARREHSTSSLAVLLTHQCWDCSLTLSHCLLIPQIPQHSDLRCPSVAYTGMELNSPSLRCEWTLPGRAPGMMSGTSHCRVSPARPHSTAATARPHARLWTPSVQMAAAASHLPLGQQLWSNQHCLRFTPELIPK